MKVLVRVPRPKTMTVEIDLDVFAAMQRLQQQQHIPLRDQLRHGMKEYLNYYGVHVTKVKSE
jgi:hypothetical protein